jgi:hypothetical protein
MTEYIVQIPDDLLESIKQVARQKRISVNQFFLTAIQNNLLISENNDFSNSHQEDLAQRWEHYFKTARVAPESFMTDVVDEPSQPEHIFI